jgi:hypothetical protein
VIEEGGQVLGDVQSTVAAASAVSGDIDKASFANVLAARA